MLKILFDYRQKSEQAQKIFLALLPLALTAAALSSYFIVGQGQDFSPEKPGGSWLETAFWLSALAQSLLSFQMMDLLFRGPNRRLLAALPIPTQVLFFDKLRQSLRWIAISSLLILAFWTPQLYFNWKIALLCFALWPSSLLLSVSLSSAIILYAGQAAAQESASPMQRAQKLTAAPALALAASLMMNLILKLLAEALLKPSFLNASLTASALSLTFLILSLAYAYRVFKRHYYRILATFLDNDLILLNANYDFIGDKERQALLKDKSPLKSLLHKDILQFKRRYALQFILSSTFAILLALALYAWPDYSQSLLLPSLCLIPFILLAKPWHALQKGQLESGLIEALPIDMIGLLRAKNLACLKISLPYALSYAAALALPLCLHARYAEALLWSLCTVLAFLLLTLALSQSSFKHPKLSNALSIAAAILCTLLGLGLAPQHFLH